MWRIVYTGETEAELFDPQGHLFEFAICDTPEELALYVRDWKKLYGAR